MYVVTALYLENVVYTWKVYIKIFAAILVIVAKSNHLVYLWALPYYNITINDRKDDGWTMIK
ncbi:hypothetical protein [Bacillus mycoides]|uniref:hypothetical protein n=1 Tax=Bacillus mycoides TaxID=1405 RepID=UPI0010BE1CA0|nr:hypothetical protein [Bacillus mycoides]TKI38150.1 hypothetical protein FC700_22585 [Bacillus mycoides]